MSTTKIPLSLVSVASPCTASWDGMAGDDTARFCGQCSQHVYNLSELTETQAEALIMEHEGRLCVRYYKRFDGTVMTKDCPVGWRAIKRHAALVGGMAVAVCGVIFSVVTAGVFAASVRGNGQGGVDIVNPITRLRDIFFPPVVAGGIGAPPGFIAPGGNPPMVMGEMCPPEHLLPPVPEQAPPELAIELNKK